MAEHKEEQLKYPSRNALITLKLGTRYPGPAEEESWAAAIAKRYQNTCWS